LARPFWAIRPGRASWAQGTPLAIRLQPHSQAKGPAVIDDPTSDDIRALFDWRSASHDGGEASPSPVANDDLAMALSLLSCNPRDREQFRGASAA
jgi:hypothetical protein